MTKTISKTKRTLALVAIFFSTLAVMADLAITPVIGMIYGYYPDHTSAVNYIVSGPMLVLVAASLITPLLTRRFNKKTVFIAAAVIFSIGAIFGAAADDPLYICFTRTLVGIGEGVINAVGIAYIADLYENPQDRNKITGFYNAAQSLMGMILSYAAGMLAANGIWMEVYKLYWLSIPMLILVILFLPSVKPNTQVAAAKEEKKAKEAIGWRYWYMSAIFFIANILLGATILYYLSSYIFENNLGDSSFAGLSTAVKSVVGILIGIVYGVIAKKLGRWTSTVSYAIAGITLLLLIWFPGQATALVIGTICGLTYKVLMSYNYGHGFSIVPASRADDVSSITTAVYGLGCYEEGMLLRPSDLIFANEVIGYLETLVKGFPVDQDTLAEDLIDEVGPGGTYLMEEHTMEHLYSFWTPDKLAPRKLGEGVSLEQDLAEAALAIIEKGPRHPLSPGKQQAIDALMEKVRAR